MAPPTLGDDESAGTAAPPPTDTPTKTASTEGDGGDDLRGIQVTVASGGRTIQNDGSLGEVVEVETPHGTIKVYARGDPSRPTILTYPDLGLNAVMNFQSFFQHPDMTLMLQCFRVVCMNAPGMEEQAPNLPDGYVYPNMDQLAETVERVRTHLNIRNFIGFGVGLGANVLCRYTLEHPSNVDALLLINCSASTCGWMEWAYQKLNVKHLRKGQMTTGAVDYLMWHSFGKLDTVSQDVVKPFKEYFEKHCNATNLSYIVEAYIGRNDLHIVREMDQNKKKEARMLRCPVLNITSNASPHVDATVAFNARLDPSNSSWMKIQDAGMVLEEKPTKMAEAFKLFLQGQGYVVGSSRRASSVAPSHIEALQSRRLKNRQNSLPLIRDVPIVKPSAELSSRLATTEENAAEGAEALASIIPMSKDDSVIKTTPKEDDLVSKDGGGAAAEKDIRITENPLEQPSV